MKLIPTSRRFIRDCWHPYGHKVTFRQSVLWPSGGITRHTFSDIGVNRNAAIGNALRHLSLLHVIGEDGSAKCGERIKHRPSIQELSAILSEGATEVFDLAVTR